MTPRDLTMIRLAVVDIASLILLSLGAGLELWTPVLTGVFLVRLSYTLRREVSGVRSAQSQQGTEVTERKLASDHLQDQLDAYIHEHKHKQSMTKIGRWIANQVGIAKEMRFVRQAIRRQHSDSDATQRREDS